jgi:hypothetical protein
MDERRLYKRFFVDMMDIHGRIMFSSNVKILNISVGGVLLKTNRRLNIGTSYLLRIEGAGKMINITGIVIRSELIESQKDSRGEVVPIYTAGMKFTNLTSEKIREISDLIKAHIIEYQQQDVSDMFRISDLRLYVRFHISNPDKASVHYHDSYKVKKISFSGMLIESSHPLEIEDKLPMEMTLPEKESVQFNGRVANCRLANGTEADKYDVGVEFIDISQRNKQILSTFISSLYEKDGLSKP